MPYELGALLYRSGEGENEGKWMLYACPTASGPGSLNRFMKLDVFPRKSTDPTALNPPLFILAGDFESLPNRNEIDSCMSR